MRAQSSAQSSSAGSDLDCMQESEDAFIGSLGSSSSNQPAIISTGTWKRIDFTVDSGSAVSGIPRSMLPEGEEIRPPLDDGPKTYTSASKHQVQVVGEASPTCAFQNNTGGRVELRVLDPLKKALLSVSKMNRTHIVHLDGDHSWAKNRKTGKVMRIYMRGGVYVLPAWIRCHPKD